MLTPSPEINAAIMADNDNHMPFDDIDNNLSLPINILLAEDDEFDVALTQIALNATHISYTMDLLKRGTDIVPYLTQEGSFAEKPRPDLLLLDLGLPGQDGFEVLAELSTLPLYKRNIPIVILTGYSHLQYLQKCYDLNIIDYVAKPCSSEKVYEALAHAALHH